MSGSRVSAPLRSLGLLFEARCEDVRFEAQLSDHGAHADRGT
jgi:hypothetical protein